MVKCATRPLTQSTHYVRNRRSFAVAECYALFNRHRLFGARCAKCAIAFSKSDLVMRARECIYHLDCFRCMACSRQLVPGDEFALRDDGLYCKADFEVVERGNNNNDSEIVMDNVDEQDVDSDNSSSTAVGQNSTSNNSNVSSARSSKSFSFLIFSPSAPSLFSPSVGVQCTHACACCIYLLSIASGCAERASNYRQCFLFIPEIGTRNERGSRKSDHKTTRVRTVLNEKQLHTLRTCYAANPRPDALMKEQLVEMTGLSPRVIRVWFQNKRCKDKKKSILMKQMHEQQQKQVRWAKEPMGIL